jgi:hypothetical protein
VQALRRGDRGLPQDGRLAEPFAGDDDDPLELLDHAGDHPSELVRFGVEELGDRRRGLVVEGDVSVEDELGGLGVNLRVGDGEIPGEVGGLAGGGE